MTAVEAVGELIRARSMRVEVTRDVAYTVKGPCLLAQLAEALAVGGESGGRGKTGSRLPINADVSDLWWEVSTSTHAWAASLGIERRPPAGFRSSTPWVGVLLRKAAADSMSRGFAEMADRIETNALRWTRRIEGMLSGLVEQRPVRGATCRVCAASWVTEVRPGDGTYRVPAIVLIVRDGERDLVCLACGWSQVLGDEGALVVAISEAAPDGPSIEMRSAA